MLGFLGINGRVMANLTAKEPPTIDTAAWREDWFGPSAARYAAICACVSGSCTREVEARARLMAPGEYTPREHKARWLLTLAAATCICSMHRWAMQGGKSKSGAGAQAKDVEWTDEELERQTRYFQVGGACALLARDACTLDAISDAENGVPSMQLMLRC